MINRFWRKLTDSSESPKQSDDNKIKSYLLQNYGPSIVNNMNVPAWLNPSAAFNFYRSLSPLTDAINKITDGVASITPLIYDNKNKVFIDDHKLLDLLHSPNTNLTYADFIRSLIICYLATGNGFLVDSFRPGKLEDPPLEIFNVYPQNISITLSAKDGYPDFYQNNTAFSPEKYYRYYRNFRFLDDQNPLLATKELYQIKNFNPNNSGEQPLWGMPASTPLYYELQQFAYTSVHNLSQLTKGARPSGVLTTESNLTDSQFTRLQSQISNFYQGAQNAGNVILFEGIKATFTPTSQNNKDMDFAALCNSVITRIYNIFNIPLPLINSSSMTLSNYQTSMLALYDQAVLPIAKFIYGHLTNFLVHRYDDLEDCFLGYDPREVTALQPRHTEEISNLQKLNVMTANEVRGLLKLDPLGSGADNLYQSGTLTPIAAPKGMPQPDEEPEPTAPIIPPAQPVPPEGQQPAQLNPPPAQTQEQQQAAKAKFIMLCRRQKDENGRRVFGDIEIEEIWKNSKI